MSDAYEDLLRDKVTFDTACGYDIDDSEIHPRLFPHQRDIVRWAVHGGRRAMFTSFGTGKSNIQLEVCRLTRSRAGGRALIVCPLGVRQEFRRDASLLGQTSQFIRWSSEVTDCTDEPDIWLTNYESIRDGRLDPDLFTVISLDEGAVLRSLGTKTFQTFRTLCDKIPHRFVATATPSPNEHTELTNYADFLGVLDRGQSLTRWFKRNSTKAGELTLMSHREEEFWAWVSTWSVWLQKPSDLGYSDEGYTLPDIDVRYHEIEVDALGSLTFENQGQGILVRDGALGVIGASKEKRDSIGARVTKAAELIAEAPDEHFILWHHLESERQQIGRQIPGVCEVFGSLDLDERERRIIAFSDGEERLLATKPSLSGSGCNFQRHCHRAIFVGIDFKFADFVQAIHRIQRFGQESPVRIDIIHADTERQVVAELNRKWKQHRKMTANMSKLIQEHGLAQEALTESLARSIGTQRVAASGEGWELVNDDTVRETRRMASESVDLIWSSPPYGTQYEYVAAVEDFGHNDDNDAFWRQMDYLTPELHRVLKPGRMCIFHTKDRIRFGNMNGRGYATVQPFAAEAIMHMIRHGFGFIGEITLDTDVVRENNQTYRLGWSEVVKDRTKLGVGTPEKILLFRKNQTDRTTGTADDPVVKTKDDYTLARWQIDAAAFWKSSGDRFIAPDELEGLPVPLLRKVFAAACESRIYDYEAHVALGDDFAGRGRLPTTFAMLAPTTESPVVWTEVNRLQSLNTSQARKGAELHVCLAEGSLVLTEENGYIPIESVQPGDHVLTHLGRWKPVISVHNTGTNDVVTMKAQGSEITLTPTHKLWARHAIVPPSNAGGRKSHAIKAAAEWREAGDCDRDCYVNLQLPPVVEEETFSVVEWWIVGRWIADGHIDKRGTAHISCGDDKLEKLSAMLGDRQSTTRHTGTAWQVAIKDPGHRLRDVMESAGRGAQNKQIPPAALRLPVDLAAAVLEGYMSGDGHYDSARNIWQASSVSRRLLYGVAMLCQRVHGTVATVCRGRGDREHVIEGRAVHARQEWSLSCRLAAYKADSFITDDGAWKPVRSVVEAGKATTWNLLVADDHSYTAEGIVVKNCPTPFDVIDRCINQWSNPGDLLFDPFSGLGTLVTRALKAGRRGKGNELSPLYWADSVKYAQAMENQVHMPSLFDMFDELGAEAS